MGTLTDLDWYLCRDRYLFIDFETPEAAHAAVKNLDGHKMSKSHQLSVNKFTDVEKYTSMSDEYVEPEVAEYKPKEHLKSWLMDPQARDQFVMYRGDDVTIYWNNKAEKPEFVKSKNVCVTFWGRKGSSSLVFFLCFVYIELDRNVSAMVASRQLSRHLPCHGYRIVGWSLHGKDCSFPSPQRQAD